MYPKYKVIMILDPGSSINEAGIGDLHLEEAQGIAQGALWMWNVMTSRYPGPVKDRPSPPVIGIVPEGYRLEKEEA